MTDEEFDVLDELYFVQSFTELQSLTEKSYDELISVLKSLYTKGWIKVLKNIDDEVPPDEIDFHTLGECNNYFLATKSGLMAHNS